MPSTFFGLYISTSGILAAQAGLQTTSHNTANENTKGYTRQVATLQASSPARAYARYGMIGSGVDVISIDQMRDSYYDVKYRSNEAKLHEFTTKRNYTLQIEDYFNEIDTDGFTTEYKNIFTTLKSLQGNPSSLNYRTEFLHYCNSVADYFNEIQSNLEGLQRECNTEVSNLTGRINNLSSQIASLTKQINTVEQTGAAANDLRDKRELLLDELSAIVPIDISESTTVNGTTHYQVKVNGFILVNDYDAHELVVVARENPNNKYDSPNLYDVYYYYNEELGSGTEFNVQSMGLSGELRSTLDMRDGNNGAANPNPNAEIKYKGIPFYYEKVQEFKETMAKAFNDIHQKATIIDENGNEVPANYNLENKTTEDIPIFVLSPNGKLSVNQELLDHPERMAVSTHPIQDGVDNAGLLDRFLKLQDAPIYRNGKATEYLESITTEISIDTNKAKTFEKNYENIQKSIENQRMAYSGVDCDEEGMNMVKYQEAFDLSSKMISVMARIYDKLINETGV